MKFVLLRKFNKLPNKSKQTQFNNNYNFKLKLRVNGEQGCDVFKHPR